jgi:gas vesicle protein
MQKRANKFMIGALVGGTIGALTTLLFNTHEGKKIQKKLMKKFHEMDQKSGHFGMNKIAIGRKKISHKSQPKNKTSRSS